MIRILVILEWSVNKSLCEMFGYARSWKDDDDGIDIGNDSDVSDVYDTDTDGNDTDVDVVSTCKQR